MRHALLCALLLAGGCGAPADELDQQPVVPVKGGEAAPVRLALLPPSRTGDAAATEGVLEVEGRCLYVRGADGARVLPALMTFDTRWEDDRLRVGDQSFAAGERVGLGGSEISGAIADLAWVQPPDPSCDASRIWITVSIGKL